MANILLADNQPIIVAGLTKFLEAEKDFRIWSASNEEEISGLLKKTGIDIIITDLETDAPFTLEKVLEIRQSYSTVKMLVFSNTRSKSRIIEILQTGIQGFVTKDCDQTEFVIGLRTILKGERFYSQPILNLIVESSLQPDKPVNKNVSSLTVREAELLTLIASGYSNQRAALAMNLSPHTVHTHRKKIVKKLNIKSPTEFLIHALDLGLVELPIKV